MHVSISSAKALFWSVTAFERTIHGPKLEFFRGRSYGRDVESLAVILELQNSKKTLRHHSRYFGEEKFLYYHVVLSDELTLDSEREAFQAIAKTILNVLSKSFKKFKLQSFDDQSFAADLSSYIDRQIDASVKVERRS